MIYNVVNMRIESQECLSVQLRVTFHMQILNNIKS